MTVEEAHRLVTSGGTDNLSSASATTPTTGAPPARGVDASFEQTSARTQRALGVPWRKNHVGVAPVLVADITGRSVGTGAPGPREHDPAIPPMNSMRVGSDPAGAPEGRSPLRCCISSQVPSRATSTLSEHRSGT